MKRFRVFDLNTPWFWLTIFYQQRYGKPWLEIMIWKPHKWKKWWVSACKWEDVPDEQGGYSVTDFHPNPEQPANSKPEVSG